MQNRHRREVGAHQNLGEHPQPQSVRHIDGRFDGVSQAVVTGIRDDADDLQPAFASRSSRRVRRLTFEIGNTDLLPDGVAVWPILPRHSLVYQRHHGSCCAVTSVEHAALDELHPNGARVIWADDASVWNEQLSRRRLGMSLERDPCGSTRIRQGHPCGVPDSDNSGKATHLRQDFRIKGSAPCEIAVFRTRQWRSHHQDMIGTEAGIEVHQVLEASDYQCCTREEDDCQGRLGNHECVAQPPPS